MVEAAHTDRDVLEYEVRGGLWEGAHALLFYGAVTCALLATLGIAPLATGIGCLLLTFYSIFTVFSSPTYVIIDPSTRQVTLERYHYFIPSRRRFEYHKLDRIEVVESSRPPAEEGETGSRRDLSYFVRVYLKLKGGKRLKIFRSGMTGAPSENRTKAFLVTQDASRALDLPVVYTRQGEKRKAEEE